MSDDRLHDLGKQIWAKIMELERLHLGVAHGSPEVRISSEKEIRHVERQIWGDLQTLFRGGVFPEDMEK